MPAKGMPGGTVLQNVPHPGIPMAAAISRIAPETLYIPYPSLAKKGDDTMEMGRIKMNRRLAI